VVRLGESSLALLIGGKEGSKAFDGCLLYHPEKGWLRCDVVSAFPLPVSGAILASHPPQISGQNEFSGIYAGGLKDDGIVADQLLFWKLDLSDSQVSSMPKLGPHDCWEA
jgi:tRNA wybutosine-synthesizing protein 4